jgi:hypothetical protein
MSEHNGGHQHMKDIIDGDHKASVKHRDGGAKTGVGGLAEDQSNGYEEASKAEAFSGGGRVGKK